jgi:hypothetical protein
MRDDCVVAWSSDFSFNWNKGGNSCFNFNRPTRFASISPIAASPYTVCGARSRAAHFSSIGPINVVVPPFACSIASAATFVAVCNGRVAATVALKRASASAAAVWVKLASWSWASVQAVGVGVIYYSTKDAASTFGPM